MSRYKTIKILFLIIFLFFNSYFLLYAQSDGIDVNVQIGSCNNNNICETGIEDIYYCPADCAQTKAVSSGFLSDNFFNNLRVEVSYDSAIIKWDSSMPTISNIKWGTNPDYKDGVIKNIFYLLNHEIKLINLKAGTLYYFNIQSENILKKTNLLGNQIFRTLTLSDTTPPTNPTNVIISTDNSGITLSWKNPIDEDFEYVRVLRNEDRYYGSPFMGGLVYEGKDIYFIDKNVKADKKYFYSLFSRDRAGNFSSGSLINIIHNPTGRDMWGEKLGPIEKVEQLDDVCVLTQGSLSYDFYTGGLFSLSGDEPIKIKTNYSSNIKNDDLWVEIRNNEGVIIGQYFFSRVKDENGFIGVTIPPFEKGGYYGISIYKYSNGAIHVVYKSAFQINKIIIEEKFQYSYKILWPLLFIPVIIFIIYSLIRIFSKFKK